jgi:hypothetical protein
MDRRAAAAAAAARMHTRPRRPADDAQARAGSSNSGPPQPQRCAAAPRDAQQRRCATTLRAMTTIRWALAGVAVAVSVPVPASVLATAAPWPLRQWPVTLGGDTAGGDTAAVVDLTSCGGVADGVSDNAPAFHRCLSQLQREGGGTLVVSHRAAGSASSAESVYASMPIVVNVSRITFRLEAGVRLLGMCNISAWPTRPAWKSYAGIKGGEAYYAPFVHAVNVTDFKLEGGGVIDGQGGCWWKANCPHKKDDCRRGVLPYERPRLLVVEDSQRISLSGITAERPGYWTVALFQSSDIHVSNVTVRNPAGGVGPCNDWPSTTACYGPNSDGIDLISVTR